MKKHFLNTVAGSWLKVGLSAILGQYLVIISDPAQTLYSWDTLKAFGIVGSVAVVPIIINWLNPNDPRYGNQSKKNSEIVDK